MLIQYQLEEGDLENLFREEDEMNQLQLQQIQPQEEIPNNNQEEQQQQPQQQKTGWWSKLTEKAAMGAAAIGLGAQPVLGAIGFSSVGPVAGSIAAGIQASIGNVAAGSVFSVCQSIAMGGIGATALPTLAVVGVVGCAGFAAVKIKDKYFQKEEQTEP